jgi:hypothetical protein
MQHLDESLQAGNVQLTSADIIVIEKALSQITVHGGRMNEGQMGVVDKTK